MSKYNESYKSRMVGVMKWLLPLAAFIVAGILLMGAFLGWFDKSDDMAASSEQPGVVDGDGNFMEAGKVYPMPTAMAFSSEKLAAAIASGNSVDVKISATVTPMDAANQAVDFSVAWGAAPTNGTNAVTDYVTVTPDSDGSTKATVSCKKAFGSDQIIITVTTRDGGYTATCTVTFIGKANNMSITSSTLTPKSNSGRGSYFEAGTGQTYDVSVNLSNIFGNVGSKNLSVKLSGVGSLYFGKYHRVAQGTVYEDIHQIEMSELASKFITSATVSGTTLSVTVGSTIMTNYYSSMDSSYRYDRYVASGSPFSTGNYNEAVAHNEANIDNCYFTVTVKDSVSGLEQTIKLWPVSSVSGVSLSQDALSF